MSTETLNFVDNVNNQELINQENIKSALETKFTSKEMLYYKMIDKFFKKLSVDDIKKMINIIEGESDISLRLLDWFVTRYAYKHKITYNNESGDRFNVHICYKAQLKSYKKRYFDPFRRRKKFIYTYNNEIKLITTIGQLNFFRWAFTNSIIKYVDENYPTILKSMAKANKDIKIKKQSKNVITKEISQESNQEVAEEVVKQNKSQKIKKSQVNIKKDNININAEKQIQKNQMKITLSFS